MKLDVWHIQGSSFHFGRRGLGQEESALTFPSDSLFAALIARLAILKGDPAVQEFTQPFLDGAPPFLLTSVYPRAGSLLFFPAPNVGWGREEEPRGGMSKQIKRVRFLSEGVYRAVLGGRSLVDLWDEVVQLHDGKVLLLSEERDHLPSALQGRKQENLSLWTVVRRPRVAIERQSSASQIYHTGQTIFNEGCGLWFGLNWMQKQDDLERLLSLVFTDLGYAGLGGERSSGFGACEFKAKGTLEFSGQEGNYVTTLSRYLPKPREIEQLRSPETAYDLTTIGGWIGSPRGPAQRRRAVTFLTEGSVIASNVGKVAGQMVDVQPRYEGAQPMPHPVWRNGYAVTVDVQVKERER